MSLLNDILIYVSCADIIAEGYIVWYRTVTRGMGGMLQHSLLYQITAGLLFVCLPLCVGGGCRVSVYECVILIVK